MPFAVTVAALAGGATIKGFEYVMRELGQAAAGVNTDDEDTDSGDADGTQSALSKSSVARVIDDIAELSSRVVQTYDCAA